jgi:NTP pyrophosphatase (non-canonical NTP hydrolase)
MNGLNKDRTGNLLQELLVITMEECGELIQECSKQIRFGSTDYSKLQNEIGDVVCMIELLQDFGIIDNKKILTRVETKKNKLKKWSTHLKGSSLI